MKQAQQRRERIQEQNRELAVKTCEQKPRFEEIKSELRRQSTEVDELRESYASKYEQLSKEAGLVDISPLCSQIWNDVMELKYFIVHTLCQLSATGHRLCTLH